MRNFAQKKKKNAAQRNLAHFDTKLYDLHKCLNFWKQISKSNIFVCVCNIFIFIFYLFLLFIF
jgi:hypothetical protein